VTSLRKLDKGNTREQVQKPTPEKTAAVEAELTTSYRELDRLIVTVSSAVLGVSVPFAGTVIQKSPFALVAAAAWFSYAVAVVAVMWSLRLEQRHKNRILDLDNLLDSGVKLLSKRLDRANKISARSFGMGTTLVAVFLLLTVIATQSGK
jgi:hypothetical protein